MSATDWALLIALSVLWGGSFYFAKIAVLEIPPLMLAFVRVLVAALALAAVAGALGLPFPRDRWTWWNFTIMAAFNNALPFTVMFWGQIYIPVGLASILNATSPLFGVLIAHLLTHDDRFSAGRAFGLLAGFAGVVVLIGTDMLRDFGTHVLAELACLAAAASFALGAVLSRRARGMPPIMVAAGQLTMSTVLLAPVALAFESPSLLFTASRTALWAMLGLALLSSALAYLIYFRLIGRAGATNALLVTFLSPVSAIVLGTFLLDEGLEAHQLIGMIAIFVGLAAIDGRPARRVASLIRR
jgi:drug/metabolite transporter (DMT)-like permease